MKDLYSQARAAVRASRTLATLSTDAKNAALTKIVVALLARSDEILAANNEDVERVGKPNIPANAAGADSNPNPMLDRLLLTPDRIRAMAKDIETVIALPDPVGEMIDERTRPNGLTIQRVRVPLGVVGMIYESRPNVTVDAAVLCLKSGNAVMLKGGSDAISTNRVLAKIMKEALEENEREQGPAGAGLQFIDSTDRTVTAEFLKLKGFLDVIIPRGGKGLIDFVTQNSTVPVIETGASVVHTYVDEAADFEMAVNIVVNAKTRRVSICNALDTLLVHEKIAEKFLAMLTPRLHEAGVKIRIDEAAFGIEFLDYVLAIKTVKSLNEALDHIAKYSLKHSEAIVTEDRATAERFLREVDAACVYWNASTQFTDGAQFGLGAEMGVSTQKIHARGPFALEGLTTYKWVVYGEGQIRP